MKKSFWIFTLGLSLATSLAFADRRTSATHSEATADCHCSIAPGSDLKSIHSNLDELKSASRSKAIYIQKGSLCYESRTGHAVAHEFCSEIPPRPEFCDDQYLLPQLNADQRSSSFGVIDCGASNHFCSGHILFDSTGQKVLCVAPSTLAR
jgi:hypothetical protein